jgi:tetratricopeptide (TPR) repeat protein
VPSLEEQAASAWEAGQREASIGLLEQALDQRSGDLDLRRRLADRQLAVHRYAAALETARAGGDALRPVTAQALFLLGRFEESLPLLDPEDPTQALARVEALEILGRTNEARDALEALVDVPGVDPLRVLLIRARLDAATGDHEQAAVAFEAVLAEAPYEPGALFGLGQAWVRTGRREEGLELLARHRELVPLLDQLDFAHRAVDLAPADAPGHALVGDAERAIGRTEVARQAYVYAAQLATTEQIPPIALRLARLLEEDLGQVDEALEVLDGASEGVSGAPPDVRLMVRAGDVLMRAGRPAEALVRYQHALDLRPTDGAIQQRLQAARAGSDASSEERSP